MWPLNSPEWNPLDNYVRGNVKALLQVPSNPDDSRWTRVNAAGVW